MAAKHEAEREPTDERKQAAVQERDAGRGGVGPELAAGKIFCDPAQGSAGRRQGLRSRPLEQQHPGEPCAAGKQGIIEEPGARGHDRYQRRCSACSNAPSAALTAIAKARISTSSAYMVWLSKLL